MFEIDRCLTPILAVLLLERAIWMKDNVIPHGSIIVREFVRLAALHIFLHGQSCLLIRINCRKRETAGQGQIEHTKHRDKWMQCIGALCATGSEEDM